MGVTTPDTGRTVYFTAPETVEVRESDISAPAPAEVVVEAECSAISSGTELLAYRGQLPGDMQADLSISALDHGTDYPLAYGYALVGVVRAVGEDVSAEWIGRRVVAFHPHATYAVVPLSDIMAVPDGCLPGDAVLFPSMETAVNLMQDGEPKIGERVLVLGQGIVGLMTTAALARFPLCRLITADYFDRRRTLSEAYGASVAIDPSDGMEALRAALGSEDGTVDVTFELSGNPEAINTALEMTGYSGRVILGSWYGRKQASLNLGGTFHRSRVRLESSQVSTIDPSLRGRWSKERRARVAWQLLQTLQPASSVITHRFSLDRAADAYRLLDQHPDEAVQVVFDYT